MNRDEYEEKKIADLVETAKWALSIGHFSNLQEIRRDLKKSVEMGDFGPDIAWKAELKIIEECDL